MTGQTLPGREAPPRFGEYELERRRHRIGVPERFNAVLDSLVPWSASDPSGRRLVSVAADGSVIAEHSAAELAAETRAAANAPMARGVGKGDRECSSCCLASRPGTPRCWARCGSARCRLDRTS